MTERTPRVLVPIADGTEEMEFTIVVDVLRRAGVEVVTAGLDGPDPVTCSRGVRIVPDEALDEVEWPFDLVVLAGGAEGARRFGASADLGGALQGHAGEGGAIAAICAAPAALLAHGIGVGRSMTAHPSVREQVEARAKWSDEVVVEDGHLVTSQGPGTAFEFALTLVRRLRGEFVAEQVRGPMMFPA
jgi:protein DJ-1